MTLMIFIFSLPFRTLDGRFRARGAFFFLLFDFSKNSNTKQCLFVSILKTHINVCATHPFNTIHTLETYISPLACFDCVFSLFVVFSRRCRHPTKSKALLACIAPKTPHQHCESFRCRRHHIPHEISKRKFRIFSSSVSSHSNPLFCADHQINHGPRYSFFYFPFHAC